jgi:hypothetical protein
VAYTPLSSDVGVRGYSKHSCRFGIIDGVHDSTTLMSKVLIQLRRSINLINEFPVAL